jgi:glutamate dehydrogenase
VLRNEYTDSLRNHRLAREIIATQLANEIVDHMGIGFVTHLIEFVGGTIADAARAYAVVAECFEFNQWFDDVRELATVAAQTRLTVLLELARLGRSATRWMLRHGAIDGDLQALVGQFKQSIASLLQSRDGAIGERGAAWRARKADLVASGLPEALARKSANAADLARLLPMIDIARRRNCDEQKLAEVTSRVGDEMHIDWLAAHMMEILPTSHWQAMERESLLDDLFTRQNLLGALVLEQADGNLRQWLTNTPQFAQVWNDAIDDVRHASHIEFSLYAVAIRKLADLCTKQGC